MQERQAGVIPLELVDGARRVARRRRGVYTSLVAPWVVVTAFGGRLSPSSAACAARTSSLRRSRRARARARAGRSTTRRARNAHHLMGRGCGSMRCATAVCSTLAARPPPPPRRRGDGPSRCRAADDMRVQVPPGWARAPPCGPGARRPANPVEVPPGAAAGSVFQVQVPPAAMEMNARGGVL